MAYLLNSSEICKDDPQMMHIDLNSAFATIEQQANPLLRGKPIGVCSYVSPGGIILAASYEAKALGIATGTPVRQAKEICPSIVVMMPDPDKYYYVNSMLYRLFNTYTSDITPLSVDEFVLDFSKSRVINSRPLINIAREIKRRIHYEIGDWMRVNIGIGTNRFLAKTAASLHKPNGLDKIDHHNLRTIYKQLELRDLCGINYRMEARLNTAGIFTPIEFLDASNDTLKKRVYKSIEGYRWYQRLRGYEIDAVTYGRKSFGNDFAIYKATADKHELSKMIIKLCEKTGRRLRRNNYLARGAHLWLLYDDNTYWHTGNKTKGILYSTNDIFSAIMRVFNRQPEYKLVSKIGISVYGLEPTRPEQTELFETLATKQRKIASAIDKTNDIYGEFAVIPALMMNMQDTIIKRVPFGGTKDLLHMYQSHNFVT